MLVSRFKEALGKSKSRQSLYEHSLSSTQIALQVARMAGEEPGPRLDRLLFATFIHDVGKLDPNFQAMLDAVSRGGKLPAKKVKHEASTFDYELPQLVLDSRWRFKGSCRRFSATGWIWPAWMGLWSTSGPLL
jgi:hypothetical protein